MTNDENSNYEYSNDPDELKEDIERTRNRMSEKIDTIQEKFAPDNLRYQAQDAVRGVMSDSADALVGYVKEHSRDLGASLVDAIKRHPVPTALIGFGLGWMLVEQMTGSGNQNGGRQYGDQSYRGQSYSPQSVPVYDQYGRRQDRPSDANWGYSSYDQSPSYGQSYEGGIYRGPQTSSYGYSQEQERSGGQGVRGMVESAKETVGQIGDTVKHSAHQVQESASSVGSTVQSTASSVGSTVQSMASTVRDQSEHLAGQAQYYGAQAQYQTKRAGYQIQESIEANPLVFGAVALAVGAAVGMMLPSTRHEDEMLGAWRDEVVHRAQEVAGDVRERAQHVVDEVKPELQQTVEKVTDDLKQTGKGAMEELQQTGKEAATEIRHAATTAEAAVKDETKPKGSTGSSTSNQGSSSGKSTTAQSTTA